MPRSGELFKIPKKEIDKARRITLVNNFVILLIEMMRRLERLAGFLFPAFLVLTTLFLAYRNYTPGTFLVGWDSLHPEFNFNIAFNRIFSGVWREDQGIGAIAAHSHMADLPRVLLLWLSSFFVQTSFLRYSYIFLCLILGPLGVYFFLKYVFEQERGGFIVKAASFLGALYYLLNLGTLQHFFVPFEMFNAQYAFLPWLILFVLKILREEKRKNYLLFAIICLLASPMAYASTLFYAYLGGVFVFVFFYLLFSKFRKTIVKRAVIVFSLIFAVNSFWILPNLYSIVNQSETISNSKINVLFSPEAFIRNESYGQLSDVVIHKNFLFDWRAFDFNSNTFVDLMGVWNKHLANPNILTIGYILAAISFLGFLVSIIQRNKIGIVLMFVGVYCLFFLVNTNYPTGAIYKYLYDNFALFREGFRLPFTKFSILFMFAMSFYFGYFFFKLKAFSIPLLVPTVFLLTLLMLPAFDGSLISPIVRRELPKEYFDVFNWFSGKEGRVAQLPIHTLWGWDYHDWKYEGSGFLSFGIDNPLLIRDFDRWSSGNESFYGEAAFALYANNQEAFIRTLEKYQIKYLLFDESLVNAGGGDELLLRPQIKNMLSSSDKIKEVAKFGFITIYDADFTTTNNSLYVPQRYIKVESDMTDSQEDPIYAKNGTYIEDVSGPSFPFSNFDKRYGNMMTRLSGESLLLENNKSNISVRLPISNEIIESFGKDRGFPQAFNCDLKKIGNVFKENLENGVLYRSQNGGVSCDFFSYPDLPYKQSFVLRIKGENKEGRSLKIYFQNYATGRMDIEELLPNDKFDEFFFVLPKNQDGSGYSLNLETRSFGRIASENIVEAIEFIPIPADWLRRYSPNSQPQIIENNLRVDSVSKLGTAFYSVKIKGSGLLELGQGFDNGWIAVENLGVLKHVKVNSWANGWIVDASNNNILIAYWPQLLEYLGFLIGISVFSVLMLTKRVSEDRI